MSVEIERRFLLANDNWRNAASLPKILRQGYLNVEKERTIRVRIIDNQAWLTLKGYISDVTRSEFEYEIPLEHAEQMMDTMCPFKMEKTALSSGISRIYL
ncbi:putative adenylate cyclase [Neisseria animalis]|nr:putative adenylate cyclase [Neisseria animalis]